MSVKAATVFADAGADTFRVFPTFLDESRLTVARLTAFSQTTNPLITQLRPAARELSPTLIDLKKLAPDLQLIFVIAMVDDHARKMHLGHGISCHVDVIHPKSRGEVTHAG